VIGGELIPELVLNFHSSCPVAWSSAMNSPFIPILRMTDVRLPSRAVQWT
jgi:hypothetical protein